MSDTEARLARPAPYPVARWPWLCLALLLGGLALITPVNHDEDQYVAAAWARAQGFVPFADFMYLQTPLQPTLTAGFFGIVPGGGFIALRLLNAAAGLLTLFLVYLRLREVSVMRDRWALLPVLLIAGSVPFLFGVTLARNDALPTLLLATAMLGLQSDKAGGWGFAGLGLGLAASVKISFGLPLACGGLWLLWLWLRAPTRGNASPVLAYGIGGLIGLLPIAVAWNANPQAFEYGVFRYAAEAAAIWYDLNGVGGKLSLLAKARDSLVALLMGPALIALGLVVAFRHPPSELPDNRNFARALIVGGLLAALLPTPTYRQYFIVLMPPLFARLGLDFTGWYAYRWVRWPMIALASAAVLVYAGLGIRDWALNGGPAAWRVTAQAAWIGEQVRGAGLRGSIVTFSPSYVVDSGVPLDLRFTTGVHVWRSADLRSDAEQRALNVTSRRTLAAELDRLPPAAILTGFEGRSGVNIRVIPDDALNAWARSRGYRAVRSPWGGLLWLRQGA